MLDTSHLSFRAEAGLSPSGAAIRLSISFRATRGRPCHFDAYLDPRQSESRYIFRRLMAQDEVQVCLHDPEGNRVGQALIPLTQADRNELARTVMRGIAHNLTVASVDFEKARHCMMRDVAIQDMPLEQFKSFSRDLYN